MPEFNWQAKLESRHSGPISEEERFQAFIERMKKEGLLIDPNLIKQKHTVSCNIWNHPDKPESLCTCSANEYR